MILDKIVEKKLETLSNRQFHSENKYLEIIDELEVPNSFYNSIKKDGLSIIGEIKKASPSKGLIKEDFHPVQLAKEYEKCVEIISVLTEEYFFMGKLEYLAKVNRIVSIPTLRKDFIIDERQIYEARINGASAVLLISAILEKEKLKRFIKLTRELSMDALVEVHNEKEVKDALEAGAYIIGINNRNLKDFSVDLNTTINLKKFIPKDVLIISESGINTKQDIKFLGDIDGILVGETFMRSGDIYQKAREFKEAYGY